LGERGELIGSRKSKKKNAETTSGVFFRKRVRRRGETYWE